MTICRVFLLHEHAPKSYIYLKCYQVEAPDEEPIKHLEQTALAHIKSHSSFRRLKSFEMAKPKIYLVRRLCSAQIARNFILGSVVFEVIPGAVATGDAESDNRFPRPWLLGVRDVRNVLTLSRG